MQMIVRRPRLFWICFLLVMVSGCGSADERLVDLSQRSLERQSKQNEQMALQSQEVAQATSQLVTADANARQALFTAQAEFQQHVQCARQALDRQYESLEVERKQLAAQRHREPILAAAIGQSAMLLACLLPLLLCYFVLNALRHPVDSEFGDLLVREFTDPKPQLLENNPLVGLAAPPSD